MTGQLLITGASGFVGSALAARLLVERPDRVVAGVRSHTARLPAGLPRRVLGDLTSRNPSEDLLEDIDVLVHAAARVHVMHDEAGDPLAEYRRVNVDGTLHLARQAASAGVRRFIFISSIKVNGESTQPGRAFRAEDAAAPTDPYAVSKLEAEEGLRQIADHSSMELVVIRPPLVYGPGVGANFREMMRWIVRGVPLPLGAIHNRRSLISIDNLVDLVMTCIDHPSAAGQLFLASDGHDLSTTELICCLAKELDARAFLLPVPAWVLRLGAGAFGRKAVAARLCDSLQVDIGKTRELLGWKPPVAIGAGLAKVAQGFLREARV